MDHPTAMALRDALWTATQLAGPPLLIVLGIGFTISLLQALTQIQEATLAFLPKVASVGLALLALGPWMGGVMQAWAARLFDQVVLLGGMP
ncbi:flagellar biosynthetic protein FliQ [Sabulicella rubraurantiaca]|uniref:flagellar biosynthetic protein FliQ n=1 Tax=Sabulicella rubraurantiaca TaxID=2811429 RepID=UPI001A97A31D|nr:flagellar biosynthetic protein FliQ [Sabulicella rubraurantiaca]